MDDNRDDPALELVTLVVRALRTRRTPIFLGIIGESTLSLDGVSEVRTSFIVHNANGSRMESFGYQTEDIRRLIGNLLQTIIKKSHKTESWAFQWLKNACEDLLRE